MTQHPDFPLSDPQQRIVSLLNDVRSAHQAGRDLDEAALIAAHPDLAPALAAEIEKLRRIRLAHDACRPDDPLTPTLDPQADLAAAIFDNLQNSSLAAASSLQETPGTLVGHYKLLQLIGEGGFGSVFMAEQERPVVRKVALKIIKLGMDTRSVIARFEAERQALAIMDHPHIARVFDAGSTGTGRPYFVMELVKGEPITKYADRNHLTIRDRLELFTQVCNAVQHAHQKGIIHRDIKPSNVLVSTPDGRPFAKVIDFGIAKAMASRLTDKTLFTEFQQFIGTPQYMSPEQADGLLDIDTRTDVYSLGVLLYELLTGSTPFPGQQLRSAALDEIRRIIREVDPPKLSTRLTDAADTLPSVAAQRASEPKKLLGDIRGELDWIVMKSLEKDRARRYESPHQLAEDIARHLAGQTVTAAPPTWLYRARKFTARYKSAVATAAAIALVLIAGTIVSTTQALRARRAEQTVSAQLLTVAQNEREAARQRDDALAANQRATAETRKNADLLSEYYADKAFHAEEQGDLAGALLRFAEAWQLDRANPDHARINRLRLSVAYRRLAQPLNVPPVDIPGIISKGRIVLTGESDRLYIADARTQKPLTPVLYKGHALNFRFSPDGNFLFADCDDGTQRFWDTATGRLLFTHNHPFSAYETFTPDSKLFTLASADKLQFLDFQKGVVTPVVLPFGDYVFSPDSQQVFIFPTNSSSPRIWDVSTGQPSSPPLDSAPAASNSAFSPDGEYVAISDWTETFKIWNAKTGEPYWQKTGDGKPPSQILFSPDSSTLWVEGRRTITAWDVQKKKNILSLPRPLPDQLWAQMTLSPDGSQLALAIQNSVFVYDARSGTPLCAPIARFAAGLAFSPDGRRITTAFPDEDVTTWDIYSAAPLTLSNHAHPVKHATYSRDGRSYLVVDQADRTNARLYDSATAEPISPAFTVTTPYPTREAFTIDGRWLTPDSALLDTHTGISTPIHLETPQQAPAAPLAITPDGSLLLTRTKNTFRVWNLSTGQPICPALSVRADLSGSTGDTLRFAGFSPDASHVAVYTASGEVHVWDIPTGHEVPLPQFIEFGQNVSVYSTALFTPDGKYFAVGGHDSLWLCDLSSGHVISRSVPTGYEPVFSPDGRRVCFQDQGNSFFVYNLDPFSLAFEKQLDQTAPDVEPQLLPSFSPDGKYLAIADGIDGSIWDAATGLCVADHLPAQFLSTAPGNAAPSSTFHVEFSPDGRHLLLSGQDTVSTLDFSPLPYPEDTLTKIAEFMNFDSLDRFTLADLDKVGLPYVDYGKRDLLSTIPDLFKEIPIPNDDDVRTRYKAFIASRVSDAQSPLARQQLAKSFDGLADNESAENNFSDGILLLEAAVQLDPANLALLEKLAKNYFGLARYDEALPIYQQHVGDHYTDDDGHVVPFGKLTVDSFLGWEPDSHDDPTLAKIKSLLAPFVTPATAPASQPATTPAATQAPSAPDPSQR